MELFDDRLALPGSVGLGLKRKNGQMTGKAQAEASAYGALLTPLRRLLRPSLDSLGSLYRYGGLFDAQSQDRPGADYRAEVLKLRLKQVRTVLYRDSASHWLIIRAADTESHRLAGRGIRTGRPGGQ